MRNKSNVDDQQIYLFSFSNDFVTFLHLKNDTVILKNRSVLRYVGFNINVFVVSHMCL